MDFVSISFFIDIILCMRILSFDISSSTVGWAVFDIDKKSNIKLFDSGFFKPLKNGHIFNKLQNVRNHITILVKQYKPNKTAIEEIAQFMPKVSSANTIITLALYNRIVGLTIFDLLKEPPAMFSVMSIRHGLKLTKDLPKKEDIPQLVENILNIKLPVQYKKNGSIKSEMHDQADAIACGLYYCYKLTNQLNNIKQSRKQ